MHNDELKVWENRHKTPIDSKNHPYIDKNHSEIISNWNDPLLPPY